MGGVLSAYTQSQETDFIYDTTSSLMAERVLRMMYPNEIDSNQFPNSQGNETRLPPEFTDATSLYGVPYVLMQKRKTAIKKFVHRKLQDPQAFWMHFCETLDIDMNPKPTVIIRVDQDGMIHTKCENGNAEIRIEFDEDEDEEEDKKPKKKKEKKPEQKQEPKPDNIDDLEYLKDLDDLEDKDIKTDKDDKEDHAIDDLDDEFESESQFNSRKKDSKKGKKGKAK